MLQYDWLTFCCCLFMDNSTSSLELWFHVRRKMSQVKEYNIKLLNVHIGLNAPGLVADTAVSKGDYQYWHYGCDNFDDRGWGCGYRTLQTMCSWIKYQLEATNQDLCSTSYPADDSTPLHLHNEDLYGICVIASGEDSVSNSITKQNTLSDIGVSDNITQNISFGVGKASINEVPSIPKAQEALVTMGDKPSEFYGSHQWIGSYEVCLCIDYFFKVPCRILHVSKGSELKQHLSALENHFKNLGSPVMMGGDTDNASKGILGVCTRPAALLVLDPHYYGPVSDVATLQAAGFIRWTPIEDFHENSFYNFCIPQLAAAEEKQQII